MQNEITSSQNSITLQNRAIHYVTSFHWILLCKVSLERVYDPQNKAYKQKYIFHCAPFSFKGII